MESALSQTGIARHRLTVLMQSNAKRAACVVDVSGFVLAALVVGGAYLLQAAAILAYPHFVPSSNLEEAAYTHIIVRNFVEYGFLNSGFLQDVASSPNKEDHPFLYNHMPPGHEILLALGFKALGSSTAVYLLQFALVPAGFVFYLLFLRRLLANVHLIGAGFVVVFISAWQLMTNTSHPHTGPFLLLLFGSLWLMHRYYQTGRFVWYNTAIALVLAASWILDYVLLAAVLASWTLLWFTSLWPLRTRDVLLVWAAIGLGILLHLVRNAVVLGPELFSRELAYVLGNRIVGYPTSEGLVSFYREAGLLHHGSRSVSVKALLGVVKSNLSYPGGSFLFLTGFFSMFLFLVGRPGARTLRLRLAPEATRAISFFLRVSVWVVGTLLTPIVLFPAFAQDMTLHGLVQTYFLAIPVLVLVLWIFKVLYRRFARLPGTTLGFRSSFFLGFLRGRRLTLQSSVGLPKRHAGQATVTAAFLVIGALLLATSMSVVLRYRYAEIRGIFQLYVLEDIGKKFQYLKELERFNDSFFLTNINVPLVGFLTRQAGFGACGLDSIGTDGQVDARRCKIVTMRQYEEYLRKRPKYFVLFTSSSAAFPGFATCVPIAGRFDEASGLTGNECDQQLRQRLDRFPVLLDTHAYRVYDLSRS